MREEVTGTGMRAATGAPSATGSQAQATRPVPNSSGTGAPHLKAPAGACDCHMHVYDVDRFPPARPASRLQANARAADYKLLQRRLGTSRTVVVAPAAYGTDNRVTLDAIAQLGEARGVAVVLPEVTDAELNQLAAGGIRGIRFTVFDPATAVTRIEMIEDLARRVADLGWHVQIHMRGDQIVENADMLARLAAPLVIDHIGRIPHPAGLEHPAFGVVRRLLDNGRTWVKLSGAYLDSKIGPPSYADVTKVAQALVKAAPERMVWGSDWPHPTEKEKPDDAGLFDLLSDWAPDDATRRRILVGNPALLYDFVRPG
jgi:predicted TIM-barrel fold metal-dependent hydrolase